MVVSMYFKLIINSAENVQYDLMDHITHNSNFNLNKNGYSLPNKVIFLSHFSIISFKNLALYLLNRMPSANVK